jgi:hypothetical protein
VPEYTWVLDTLYEYQKLEPGKPVGSSIEAIEGAIKHLNLIGNKFYPYDITVSFKQKFNNWIYWDLYTQIFNSPIYGHNATRCLLLFIQ